CFSCGVEAGHHKRTHKYNVKLSTPSKGILNGWSDEEDLSLLDAIEQYGLGNWEDVSDKCVKKSPKECFDHYNTFYLHGVLAKVLFSGASKPSHVTDHTSSPQSTPDKNSKVPLEPLEQQLLGYMVLRDDFEKDYDNDAESLLTRLKLHLDWDELENALIVAHVGIYTQRLQERQKRKEIARIHGLIQRISSYLLNRRVKRRPLSVKHQPQPPLPRKSTTKLALSKNRHRYSVVRAGTRRSRASVSPEKRRSAQPSPVSPPAGSWLAAPYALQSRGPTRGTPLVVPGVLSLPLTEPASAAATGNASTANVSAVYMMNGVGGGGGGTNSAQLGFEDELESYDAFNINEKLKPFLRYFSPQQAKQFLRNLHREEVLKHEIKFLFGVLQKNSAGCTKSSGTFAPLLILLVLYLPPPQPPPHHHHSYSYPCVSFLF
ncbi:unnamed protein product, partial [Schistocephalus solidus]|uniref:SANT domain-containing protein n=1 Tax=Schistocephalus solidus TaxID=70667 RepID=A0A183SVM0_SCHSO